MSVLVYPISPLNFTQLVNKQHPELPNLERLLQQDQRSTQETLLHRIAAITTDGEMVGFGYAASGPWDPVLRPRYFEISVQVSREWRNRGIGNRLFAELEQFAHDHDAAAIQCSIYESQPEGLGWAEKKGFIIQQHVFESTLDLTHFNILDYDNALTLKSGLSFSSFSSYPQDERGLEKYFDFWWELTKDAPGMEGTPRPEYDFLKHLFKNIDPSGSIFIVDGEDWIAMSLVIRENENVYYNSLTGVRRHYRGNKLALAIKVKAAEYAKRNGAQFMRTHNDSRNERMLAVNRRMGYEQRAGGIYCLVRRELRTDESVDLG